MTLARLSVMIGLSAGAAAVRADMTEENAWPVYVHQKAPSGETVSWTGAGPLAFAGPMPSPSPGRVEGVRPFYVRMTGGDSVKTDILYPLFFYRTFSSGYQWSVLQLLNGSGTFHKDGVPEGPVDRHFDLWPFYFSHESLNPDESYRALLPVYGDIRYRLGYQELFWAPFPVYVRTQKEGVKTTYVPWPIVRVTTGEAHGLGLWPLYGHTDGPLREHHTFFLWPLGWDNTLEPLPQDPDGSPVRTQLGILPFYTRETGPGIRSESYLWPFFGYTEKTSPLRYSERRYFWPFLVQGCGDENKSLERWAPFYTHSSYKDSGSTWVMWPLWHRTTWSDSDLVQERTQFFYFLYWSLDQASASRPALAHAHKTHLWPLLSVWDNGAGSRQVEIPSPIEVFFNSNPDMRATWTPLFSAYRFDHSPDGESRTTILWGALTWRRDRRDGLREFHLGPLLGMRRDGEESHWSILGFDFGPKPANNGPSGR